MAHTIASRRQQASAGRFVGRAAEQRMFRATLRQLAVLQDGRDDDLADDALGYAQIFLVAAEGGMGKTSLLRRFEAIVRENKEGAGAQALYLDLEQHAPIAEPERLMGLLHATLCTAGFAHEMQAYRDALDRRDAAQKKAADAVDKDLVIEDIPAGVRGLAELRAFIQKQLSSDEWILYDDPIGALTAAFMAALNTIATPKRPLVLLLDTYELADRCDEWLRERALPQSNLLLIWVIAGREGQPFIRLYEDAFDASLLGRILLDTFARPEIITYLQHCGIADPDDELVDRLQALSRGIPLALEGWLNLYRKDVDLPPPDPAAPTTRRAIVHKVTDRFLRYCSEDDRHLSFDERKKRTQTRHDILTVMLLRRTDHNALAAARGCDARQAEKILGELGDQFSFIFVQEIEQESHREEPHSLVKEFLRKYTRDHMTRSVFIQGIPTRIAAHFALEMNKHEKQIHSSVYSIDFLSAADRAELEEEREAYRKTLHQIRLKTAHFGMTATPIHLLNDLKDTESAIAQIDEKLAQSIADPGEIIGVRRALWDDALWREALFDRVNALCWADHSGERVQKLLVPMLIEAFEFHKASITALKGIIMEFVERWPLEQRQIFVESDIKHIESSSRAEQDETLQKILDYLSIDLDRWQLTKLQRALFHIQLGRSFLGSSAQMTPKNRAAALDAAEEAARLLPNDGGQLSQSLAALYKDVGRSYLRMRPHQIAASRQAASAFTIATRLVPSDVSAWYYLGMAYSQGEQYKEAINAYEHVIALNRGSALLYHGLGTVYYKIKQYDKAISAYEQAIVLDSDFILSYNGLGMAYNNNKQYNEAEDIYKKAIELNPTYLSYNGLGNVYRDKKRYDEAISSYMRANELDNTSSWPYNGLGNVYFIVKQYDRAIEAYNRAIDLNKVDARPYNGLGQLYRVLKRYEEAMSAYRQANVLDPTDARSYNGIGNIYRVYRQYDLAISAYNRAIELDSEFIRPYHGLGNVFSLSGQIDEARTVYQKAIEIDRRDYVSMICLARVERLVGDMEQSVMWLEKARLLVPDDDYHSHACLESVAGNIDAAIEALHVVFDRRDASVEWVREDPDLVFIRDDPRYRAMVGLDSD